MLGLDFPASQAPLDIPRHISLYAGPRIIRTHIFIHLRRLGLNGEPRLVGLLHLNLAYTVPIQHPNPPMQSQQSTSIIIERSHLTHNALALSVLFLLSLDLILMNFLKQFSNHGHPQTYVSDRSPTTLRKRASATMLCYPM